MNNTKNAGSKKKIIIILLALIILILAAVQFVIHLKIAGQFCRGEYKKYSSAYRYSDIETDYSRTPVSFMSGENRLQGYIYGGDNDRGLVVISHGLGEGHERYLPFITHFVDRNWRVFAYDATGSCESEGKSCGGLPQSALDLDAALTYIEQDPELSTFKKCLVGHSWGGYAVTAVLGFGHEVAASAAIAGYADPMEMMMEESAKILGMTSDIFYPFIYADVYAAYGRYTHLSAVDGINAVDIPVLILHGTGDERISFDRTAIIAKADKITNPGVIYHPVDSEKCGGHSSILRSEAANDYRKSINEALAELSERYEDNIPDAEMEKAYGSIDKMQACEINGELMAAIDPVFEEAVITN